MSTIIESAINDIRATINDSVARDKITTCTISGLTPKQVFEECCSYMDAPSQIENWGEDLRLDWNDIGQGGDIELDIWAISESEPGGSENYFWRINVRIETAE